MAIVLVMAAGSLTLILGVGAHTMLAETLTAHNECHNECHSFTDLTRAPTSLGEEIARIPGAAAVETRIAKSLVFGLPDLAEPASAMMVSLPESRETTVDRLFMVRGRLSAFDADCIAWLTDRFEARGETAPIFHAVSRPKVVEREATHRAIAFSELVDVPIPIVHVSGAEAMEAIRRAQACGLRLHAETCPQYLLLSTEDLSGPGFEGARCVCSPPPREKGNQEAIWRGLSTDVFAVFSSDRAPFRWEDPEGKKLRGEGASFRWIPNGIPGVETRMALLFSGVVDGRLSLDRFVELTATNPAKMYGFPPRKGGSRSDRTRIWCSGTGRGRSPSPMAHSTMPSTTRPTRGSPCRRGRAP